LSGCVVAAAGEGEVRSLFRHGMAWHLKLGGSSSGAPPTSPPMATPKTRLWQTKQERGMPAVPVNRNPSLGSRFGRKRGDKKEKGAAPPPLAYNSWRRHIGAPAALLSASRTSAAADRRGRHRCWRGSSPAPAAGRCSRSHCSRSCRDVSQTPSPATGAHSGRGRLGGGGPASLPPLPDVVEVEHRQAFVAPSLVRFGSVRPGEFRFSFWLWLGIGSAKRWFDR